MSDIKLFRIGVQTVSELEGSAIPLEKSLQTLIERNMETFLGVRFLASEFVTSNGGRMDSLGIDENGSPVIVEYKRATNENVINQGLFYLDWLMDHRRDFEWLVLKNFGQEAAESVDWITPRLICVAGDFTKYDAHAVNQMNRNIELVRYRRFSEELLLLEVLTSASGGAPNATSRNGAQESSTTGPSSAGRPRTRHKTVSQLLADADAELVDLFEAVKAHLVALGDDVQIKTLDNYVAFRRLKNFACVEVKPQIRHIKVFLKVNPEEVALEAGFTRDVRGIGHFGTGDLEILITDNQTLERAKPLMERSYDAA